MIVGVTRYYIQSLNQIGNELNCFNYVIGKTDYEFRKFPHLR